MRLMRTLALLCGLGSAMTIGAQSDFPIALRLDAEDRGCAPITDTAAFPGLTLPLFRYGVYPTRRDTLLTGSAIYWCTWRSAEPRTALIIWREWGREAPVPGGCTNEIRYWRRPGGLRLEPRGVMPLREARLVDEPSKRGPPVTARGMVIVTEYDGGTARFICHTGRWYVRTTP